MKCRSTDTTCKIKCEEALGSPDAFQHTSKHPKHKHIEKNMIDIRKRSVSEHVREYLVRRKTRYVGRANVFQRVLKLIGYDRLKSEFIRKLKLAVKYCLREKNKDVYNDQVLYDRWESVRPRESKITHSA